ncbi:glycosyltransferase family 4 protein [Acholeplasma equirhinis]|uniref:glycosyltransferase family 4 protein n=1 Tax=Acholeplasma equirhinis TaxID=555393 RepID=UPI00197ADAAD|nr:glycosyltransferase family 4 protein [Acholeplasma equirhinis]MBN3489969.1 glycosyltransferase family 4 protein [Acholeplasma equirhinis]
MKKVLILVNHDIAIYNSRKELVEELLKQNYEVYISSPYGTRIDKLVEMGAKFIETSIDRRGINPLNDFKLIRHYKKIMKDIKPDVILTYTIKPNIYGGIAAKSLKIPYIANITGLGSGFSKPGPIKMISTFLYKYALKKSKYVYFQNRQNLDFFKKNKIIQDNAILLPGSGVNLEEFQFIQKDFKGERQIAFVGRLMKEKGINEYLDAVETLMKKLDNIKFHIFGMMEDDISNKIEYLISKNFINYHGLVMDMNEVYKKIDIIVLPSYHEGLSNVLLEGAASGIPLIASDIPGCREIIEDGSNGYLIQPKNRDDLIYKLEKMILNDSEKMKDFAIKGRLIVEEKFDRNTVTESYLKNIKKI